MKIAPLRKRNAHYEVIEPSPIYTGRHYGVAMAGQIFNDLDLPDPNVSLEVGGQAAMLFSLRSRAQKLRPDDAGGDQSTPDRSRG